MQRFGARRLALSWFVVWSVILGISSAEAQSPTRPYFAQAQAVFDGLASRDRNEIFLELMASGDFNAMVSTQFGTRFYDATVSFQVNHGIEPSGIMTPETVAALSAVGGRIFNSWGFQFQDHPFALASLAVPSRFGLVRTPTSHGFAMENRNHTISLDFAFFSDTESNLGEIFNRLTRPGPGRRYDYKILRPTFFAIAGGSDTSGTYSRYIVTTGGIAGFTLSWNTSAFPNGNRIAVVMANELYPQHMVSDTGQSADLFDLPPPDATPTNVGSDAVSQAALQAKIETQERAAETARAEAQTRADARALDAERQRIAFQEANDRRTADEVAKQAASSAKARAEQEAREAAVALVRQQRLARASTAAKQALSDASGFIKADRDNPRLLEHLQRISDLNATLAKGEPEAIESGTAALTTALAQDGNYAGYAVRLAAERQRDAARSLADAVRVLRIQKTFLLGILSQDPTSAQTTTFLPLIKEAEAALEATDLERAQTLMGTIDTTIGQAGLRQQFASALAATGDAATSPAAAANAVPDEFTAGGTLSGTIGTTPAAN